MASATGEKKRKILVAVDLSSWAEEAFKCKQWPLYFGPVQLRRALDG